MNALDIFEPDVTWDDSLSRPPGYYWLARSPNVLAGVGAAPPSYDAACVDRALQQLEASGHLDFRAVLEYLDAVGSLIKIQGRSTEVEARVKPLIASPMVAAMSDALEVPLVASRPAPAHVRSGHSVAVMYAGLLAAIVSGGLLPPERVLMRLQEANVTTPYLLRLATTARSMPRASHLMCDLLEALVKACSRADAPDRMRCQLLNLSDDRGVPDKYTSFFDRLVGDGKLLEPEDNGTLVAIARLSTVYLWPTEAEVSWQHNSFARGRKHRLAGQAWGAFRRRSPLALMTHVSLSLQDAAKQLWLATMTAQEDNASRPVRARPARQTHLCATLPQVDGTWL